MCFLLYNLCKKYWCGDGVRQKRVRGNNTIIVLLETLESGEEGRDCEIGFRHRGFFLLQLTI